MILGPDRFATRELLGWFAVIRVTRESVAEYTLKAEHWDAVRQPPLDANYRDGTETDVTAHHAEKTVTTRWETVLAIETSDTGELILETRQGQHRLPQLEPGVQEALSKSVRNALPGWVEKAVPLSRWRAARTPLAFWALSVPLWFFVPAEVPILSGLLELIPGIGALPTSLAFGLVAGLFAMIVAGANAVFPATRTVLGRPPESA